MTIKSSRGIASLLIALVGALLVGCAADQADPASEETGQSEQGLTSYAYTCTTYTIRTGDEEGGDWEQWAYSRWSDVSAIGYCQDKANHEASEHCELHPDDHDFDGFYEVARPHVTVMRETVRWKCENGAPRYR